MNLTGKNIIGTELSGDGQPFSAFNLALNTELDPMFFGVKMCHAMVHGGPFPATTAPSSTSVGALAINRFSRAVCFQNFPNSLLPDQLKNSNPLGVWRLIDGDWTKNAC